MFKHILLPTDGSKLSDRAVQKGIQFAKSLGAKITVIHVAPEFKMIVEEGFVSPMTAELKTRYERDSRAHAADMVAKVAKKAAAADVACDTIAVTSDYPYQMIIDAAKKKKCDLIMMASHGRRGLSSLLLGSETAKVLTHSTIPVLVVR